MGPKSKKLVAEGQLALVDELRSQRGLMVELRRLLIGNSGKLDELGASVGSLTSGKARVDNALTELEMRVYTLEGKGHGNGAAK